jgi:16S rRNA (cytosine1402-N4)-methyltransferase
MGENGRTHRPVMLNELVDSLDLEQSNTVIDATFGFGGHAEAVLDRLGPSGHLYGFERDPTIHARARERFADDDRVTVFNENFRHLSEIVRRRVNGSVQAIYFDLGVNSFHFDESERGFSFERTEDPLDMRFDPDGSAPPAGEWLNSVDRDVLIETLKSHGEVRAAVSIADELVDRRPLNTVGDLRGAVEAIVPPPYRRGELARVFQAVRIEVNQELEHLEDGLEQAIECLEPGGRVSVISFHSLEDRTVKQLFRHEQLECVCPPELPVCACDKQRRLRVLDRSPMTPEREEIEANNRARSATMRIATKTD